MNVELRFDIRDQLQESNDFKTQLLRILQELFVNVDKHAMATQVDLTFRKSQKFRTLLLADNGNGFTNANSINGLGLKNVESRIQFLNGVHRIKSEEGKGTSVLIMFNVLK
jgi:signal transduction histidine kinase